MGAIQSFLPARFLLGVLTLAVLVTCGGGGGGGSAPAAQTPSITSFTVSPSAIAAGQSAQMTAVYSNGTAKVEPGGIVLSSGVAQSVSPAASTTYVLTVTGTTGANVSQSQILTVYPAPVINSVSAVPSTITAGGSTQITAQFTGGTGLLSPGSIPVTSGAPVSMSPNATTEYTLTVTPPAGTPVTRTVLVTVVPAATITAFVAVPTSVREGSSSQLSFQFTGVSGKINPGNLNAVSGGTLTVTPAATTTYTLTVVNSNGSPVSAVQTVTVVPRPVLTSTAPASVTHAQPVSFVVSGKDEFGSPLGPYALDHGPSGMAVSATGEVTWDAKLPMFNTSMDVSWQVSVPSYPGVKLQGTLRVNDPLRSIPLRRTGVEIPAWNAGLVIADLDGDHRMEMLIANRFGLSIHGWNGTTYAQQWCYPFWINGTTGATAVAARDLDGDSRMEIVFAEGNVLVRLDGATRKETARHLGSSGQRILDVKIADLDRDGAQEIICLEGAQYGTTSHLLVLDGNTLALKWKSAELGLGSALAIGNVDADAALEIVTAGGYVFDGATKENEWAYSPGFGRTVATGDLDGDGIQEIVGMQDWTVFKGFSAVLKSPVWEKTGSDFDALMVTDTDRDGIAEIFVGDGQWGRVRGYKYTKASNSLTEIFSLDSQDHGVTAMAVGDLDGDGQPEIAWGSGATSSGADILVVASLDGSPILKWKNANPKQLDGPFVGGGLARLAPGKSRLVYSIPSTDSGYSGDRLVALDPQTGDFEVSKELGSNWSKTTAVSVADITGTGIDRILMSTANLYDGYLTAFDFASANADWTSASNIGTTVSTESVDLNRDGLPDLLSITREGYVYAHDVSGSALIWKSTGLGTGIDVGAADLDGDGVMELVALTSSRVVAFKKLSSPGLYTELASYAISDGRGLLIADTDGDGLVEVHVLAGALYSPSKITRLSRSLALLGSTQLPVFAQSIHLEDLGTGRRNIVVSVDATGEEGPHLRAFDPASGALIWKSPFLQGTVPMHSLHFVDLDKSGARRICFGTTKGMYVTR